MRLRVPVKPELDPGEGEGASETTFSSPEVQILWGRSYCSTVRFLQNHFNSLTNECTYNFT